ncbi:spore coat protein CotH [Clostridium sporogenes]|nr:spore coat protein CotH [Clostridium sporogenes]NFS26920.1 spore coat protein CotH [Clostridium sporogenes]
MITKKNSGYISIIAMVLALVFIVVSIVFVNPTNTNNVTSSSTINTVLDKNSITQIDIKIDESDWQWLLKNATDEEYRKADVTINGETFTNVGVRPKGNSSLTSVANDSTTDRYSLKIDFGQYIKGQTYHGIKKLALNNNISDTTYMKEYLSYDMYKFLEIPTPEYSYSNIKINDESWGLYLGVEVIDERYIEKNYGELAGNLYKPETMGIGANKGEKKQDMSQMPNDPNMPDNTGKETPNNKQVNDKKSDGQAPENLDNNDQNNTNENGEKDNKQGMPGGMGGNSNGANLKYTDNNIDSYSALRDSAVFKTTTDKDFEKVIKMIKNLNNGTNLKKYLNVEEILKYFAVNTFLVNLDSYSGGMYHNYYLYEKNGVCEILPWDLNMSFAGFSVSNGTKAINFPIDSPVTGNLENAPLIGKLLEVDEYKELYHEYLEKLANEYFNNGTFANSVANIDKLISSYVKTDATAFFTYKEYKNSIPELLTFGKDRTKSVLAQLSGEQSSTKYGNMSTTLNLKALGEQSMGGGMKGDNQKQDAGNGVPNMNGDNHNQSDGNSMPNMKNMQQAMSIINDKSADELTDKEKEQLEKLGVDESMISNFQNMQGNNMGGHKEMPGQNATTSFGSDAIIYGIGLVVVLLAMLFVTKYKRKRY